MPKRKVSHQQQNEKLHTSSDLNDTILNLSTTTLDSNYYGRNINIAKNNLSFLNWDNQLKLITCLTQSQRTKVFRGFSVRFGTDLILKIVLIYKRDKKIYQLILGQADTYYKRIKKTVNDLVIAQNKIHALLNYNNTPSYKNQSQQQVYIQFTRPYLSGRNFHQQVYVHNRFPFQYDEFSCFVKYALNMLNTDTHQPVFIPTLDNIYFDGIQIVGNYTAFETYMFLRHLNQHLSTENFKQLYILLPSDPAVFCQWDKMRQFMMEDIRVKAFFVMLFCFITYRSPIEMIFGEKINQQDLQWPRLIDPTNKKINQGNKIINLIKEIPNRWKTLLDKPQNKICLEIASIQIFFELKNRDQALAENFTDRNTFQYLSEEKNYLYNLFYKIFVKEERIGWKELFQIRKKYVNLFDKGQKGENTKNKKTEIKHETKFLQGTEPLRMFLIQTAKDQEIIKNQKEMFNKRKQLQQRQKKEQKQPQQQYDTAPESESESKNVENQIKLKMKKMNQRQWKRQVSKIAFLYLHKYFVVEDIRQRKLKPYEAQEYVKVLHFQTYLPLKLGIPLTITLDYQDWFEVFFEQTGDHRPPIYDAAKAIQVLIRQKGVQMMKTIKGCELIHLKRIQYIVGEKLAQTNDGPEIYRQLKHEMLEFIRQKRPYEYTLWQVEQNIRILRSNEQTQGVKRIGIKQLEQYLSEEYDDLRLILLEYVKIQEKSPRPGEESVVNKFVKNKQVENLVQKIKMLKGPAKFKNSFQNKLNLLFGYIQTPDKSTPGQTEHKAQ